MSSQSVVIADQLCIQYHLGEPITHLEDPTPGSWNAVTVLLRRKKNDASSFWQTPVGVKWV